MKKLLLVLSVVAFATSCQNTATYTVKGTVEDAADGTMVYLCEDLFHKIIADSTTIKDNQFVFEGKLETPVMRSLKIGNINKNDVDIPDIACISCLIVLEPGQTIELTVDNKRIIKNVTVDNTEFIKKSSSSLMKQHNTFWSNIATTGTPDSESLINMIKENKDNAIGMFYFSHLLELTSPDSKALKELYSLFSDKRGQDKRLDEMLDYIKNMDNFAAVGTKYIDIKAKTPNGQEITLSDYVGKKDAVLLHFFKWSGLADDKDYTYLRNAYAKYKDKGFEIVGIWLDSNTETWKKTIDNDNMTWPQMSDKNLIIQFIKTYAVFDEPRTILIDKNGTITDRGIKGAELEAKLDKLLK